MCEKYATDEIWISQKTHKNKLGEGIGILAGAFVPFASNKQHQEKSLKTTNKDKTNVKMKIETLNQQEYSRKVMVSQDATDKNAEINQKLTDKLKEHAL